MPIVLALLAALAVDARASQDQTLRWRDHVLEVQAALALLDRPQHAAGPGDWRSSHPEQVPGLLAFVDTKAPVARGRVLYVVTLGPLSPSQARVLDLTVEFLALRFAMPVRRLPDLPLSSVSPGWWVGEQLHATTTILRLLRPMVPADAQALLAFTAADLTPGSGWNYVYGLAMPGRRAGIWSLHRFGGQPDVLLRRTLVTATHETGHLLGLEHCQSAACLMNGANYLAELDQTPLATCAEDVARLLWVLPHPAGPRLHELASWLEAHGLEADAEPFERQAQALRDVPVVAQPEAPQAPPWVPPPLPLDEPDQPAVQEPPEPEPVGTQPNRLPAVLLAGAAGLLGVAVGLMWQARRGREGLQG